jgi:hypothetical protein
MACIEQCRDEIRLNRSGFAGRCDTREGWRGSRVSSNRFPAKADEVAGVIKMLSEEPCLIHRRSGRSTDHVVFLLALLQAILMFSPGFEGRNKEDALRVSFLRGASQRDPDQGSVAHTVFCRIYDNEVPTFMVAATRIKNALYGTGHVSLVHSHCKTGAGDSTFQHFGAREMMPHA